MALPDIRTATSPPPVIPDEAGRLAALERTGVLDGPPEQAFDDLINIAAQICQTPMAMVSLVAGGRQWFKAKMGVNASETPRDQAFCAHTITGVSPLIVPDARKDPRFANTPLVAGEPHIVFYAGVPLITPPAGAMGGGNGGGGHAIGALCVADVVPRELTPAQIASLQALGRQVIGQIVLREQMRASAQAAAARRAADAQARAAEQTLRSFFDAAPLMIGIVDLLPDGDIQYVSANVLASQVFGRGKMIVPGRRVSEFGSSAEAVALWKIKYRESRTQRSPVQFEYEQSPQTGGRWIAATVFALEAPSERYGFIAEDITLRRRAEAELRSVTAHARCILFHSTIEIVAGKQVWNTVVPDEAAAQRVLPLDVPPGKTYLDAWNASWYRRDPDKMFRDAERVFAGGGNVIRNEFSFKNRHGQIQWLLEDLYLEKLGPARWRAVGVATDITAYKESQVALEQANALQRAIFDATPYILIAADERGIVRSFNAEAERALGYRAEEFIGQRTPEILHDPAEIAAYVAELEHEFGGPVPRTLAAIDLEISRGRVHDREWTYIRKDGTRFPVKVTVAPIRDASGRAIGFVGLSQDITARRRAEEALRISERRLRTLVEHLPAGAVYVEGDQLMFNAATEQMTGYTNKEIRTLEEWFFTLYPHDPLNCWQRYLRFRSSGFAASEVAVITRKDGTHRSVEFSAFRSGAVEVWLANDITVRLEAEQALAKSEQRLSFALEGAEEGLWDWDLQSNDVFFSPRWLEMLGYTTADFAQTMEGWRTTICHPEDYPGLAPALADHVSGRAANFVYEHRSRHKNGRWMWFLSRAKIVARSPAGTPLRLVGTSVNIDSQKAAEAALLESKDRITAILESITDAFITFDRQWRYTWLNTQAEKLFNIPRATLLGKVIWELFPDSVNNDFYRHTQRAMNENVATEFEFSSPTSGRWFEIHAYPSRDGLSVYMQDITARKTAAEALRRASAAAHAANQAKSDFLANMSHEIRTPMTAVLGYADLLGDPALDAAARDDYVARIRRNASHLLDLLNDMLDLSKIEAGKFDIESRECSVVAIVREVVATVRHRAAAKGLEVDAHFDPPFPQTVVTDPTRLRQVLVNLIGNAVKFTEAGSVRVHVRLEISGQRPRIEIAIADTGIGLTPEQQERIFEPFTQADASTSRKYGGTGLGLSISRRLARMLGGDIQVASTFGAGSVFTFTFEPGSVSPGEADLNDQSAAPDSPRPLISVAPIHAHILVAEDGPDNRDLILFYLARVGARVEVALNGKEAVELVRTAEARGAAYDLILMDMHMPEFDGLAATRVLRDQPHCPPIIMLTANNMEGDRERCLAAGCSDFVAKPIDPAFLMATLRQHLKSRAAPPDDQLVTAQLRGSDELRPLVERFVRRLPERLVAMEKSLAEADLSSLATQAHQLTGAAGGYGFSQISLQSAALERLANHRAETGALRLALAALREECGRTFPP